RSLALGSHPQRELTLMLTLGSSCPRARMAAGADFFHWRGPNPRRELTLMLTLGSSCPRARMAAGADLFYSPGFAMPSTSCIVYQPRLPCTHFAAASAPLANAVRSRAVCVR